MAVSSCSAFSESGRYFAACGADGKLKIWETSNNILKQEYTPNLHLTSPCTCLFWISTTRNPADTETPCRKKKRQSADGSADVIAMGTSNGRILLYSMSTAAVEAQLEGGHGHSSINSLSWFPGTNLYSCGNDSIAEWSISGGRIKSKWKAGSERVGSVLVSPDGQWVLSASRSIKWWDATSHKLLRTFTGHATPVLSLSFIPHPASNGDLYFLSTAKGDRYINAWTLNNKSGEKSAVVSLVMESEPTGAVCVQGGQDGAPISVAAVTFSGVLQLFSHQLNGRCNKPLKPSVTIQIATDSARGKEAVEPIPIVSVSYSPDTRVQLAYGHGSFLSFEKITPDVSEKLQVLVRQDPRRSFSGPLGEDSTSKVRVPESGGDVHYLLSTASGSVVAGAKRTHSRQAEVPMEERLENLSLSMARSDEKGVSLPRADNLAQLLLQAMQSKDRTMLHMVLLRREEEVLKSTVRRLPLQVIEPLFRELTTLLHAKTVTAQAAARWLRVVLSTHAAHLMANPSLVELMAPVLGLIESRLSLLPALSRLGGRLDLLAAQLDAATGSDDGTSLGTQAGMLVYQDADTSDEESSPEELGAVGSESDDHWDELSDSDEEDEEDGDEDVEMSS